MKIIYLFIILFTIILCISCTDSEEDPVISCETEKPFEDIAWLKKLKTDFDNDSSATKRKITQYNYKGKTVYMIQYCFGCADSMATVYDCDKNEVCLFGGYGGFNTCPDFNKQATNKKILWEN